MTAPAPQTRRPCAQPCKRWVPASDVPSGRELQVLRGVSNGLSNAEIGRELYLAEFTVKAHLRRLFIRVGARDRSHAVTIGFDRGWLLVGDTRPEPVELLPSELRLIGLVAQGWTYGRIAARLGYSEGRVRDRMRVLFWRVGARNRAHVVRRCFEHGLLQPGGERG